MNSVEFKNVVLDNLDNDDNTDRWFRRFIDDQFMLFHGDKDKAIEFVKWLNSLEEGISFTFEWPDKEICFLDVKQIV